MPESESEVRRPIMRPIPFDPTSQPSAPGAPDGHRVTRLDVAHLRRVPGGGQDVREEERVEVRKLLLGRQLEQVELGWVLLIIKWTRAQTDVPIPHKINRKPLHTVGYAHVVGLPAAPASGQMRIPEEAAWGVHIRMGNWLMATGGKRLFSAHPPPAIWYATYPPVLSPYMNSCARESLVVSQAVKSPFLHDSQEPQAMSKHATTRSPRLKPVCVSSFYGRIRSKRLTQT